MPYPSPQALTQAEQQGQWEVGTLASSTRRLTCTRALLD